MSWSFYVFAVGYFGTGPAFMYWSHVLSPGAYVGTFVRAEHGVRPLERPAATALRLAVSQRRRAGMATPDRSLRVGFSRSCVCLYVIEWRAYSTSESIPSWDIIPSTVIPLGAFALAGLIFAKNFATATPGDRQRFAFVALGTLVSFVAYAIYYVPGVPFAVGQAIGFAVVLMPICIAYAVFRLRVLDVNFVLNRALVFGVLSVGVIALVSILDWFFSRIVALGRMAVGLELVATIGVGFLARSDQSRRRRARGGALLSRAPACRATPAACGGGATVCDRRRSHRRRPRADSRRRDGSRRRGALPPLRRRRALRGRRYRTAKRRWRHPGSTRTISWCACCSRKSGSFGSTTLRSHLDPQSAAIYTLAVPVTVRHELISFTLYGAHANRRAVGSRRRSSS